MQGRYGRLALFLLIAGCGRAPDASLRPRWTPSDPPEPSGAFAVYVREAERIEGADPKLARRSSFYPAQRERALALALPAMAAIEAAPGPVVYAAPTRAPFERPRWGDGWRLIGRAYVWRIEEARENGKAGLAADLAVRATRFGMGLAGGTAADATLGFIVVNEARRAVLPVLPRLTGAELSRLSQGMKAAVAGADDAALAMARHEADRMLRAVQALQDGAVASDLGPFARELGRDGKVAATFLLGLKPADRKAYFDGFEAEARAWGEQDVALAAAPLARRVDEKGKPLRPKGLLEKRGWRRYSVHFLQSTEPVRRMRDVCLARTRLLVLTAELNRRLRAGQPLPERAEAFSAPVRTDPFTGASFGYRASSKDFAVWSWGANLQDDGGATDEDFAAPDLVLER